MNTQNELNKKIVLATTKIQENFPELAKHLNEIPEHFVQSARKKINKKDLKDYLGSLNELLKTYSKVHQNSSN